MRLRVVEIGIGEYAAQINAAGPSIKPQDRLWEFIKDPNDVVLFNDDPQEALLEGFKAVRQRVVIDEVDIDVLEGMYEKQMRDFERDLEEVVCGGEVEGE